MRAGESVGAIPKREDERVEFHAAFVPEMIAKAVCAFLNSGGGRVFVGVGSGGEVLGIDASEATVQQVEGRLAKLVSPLARWTIERLRVDDRDVLVVGVPNGQDKPYVVGGAIYVRRGGRVVPATRDVISELIRQRADASYRWERQISPGTSVSDLDSKLVTETMRLAIEAQRWQGTPDDKEQFLSALGLITDGAVTNAGVILYGREPSRVFPQARVRIVTMPEGKTGDRYKDDRLFEGCVLDVAKQIPDALAVRVGGIESTFEGSDWQRSDRSRYPLTAIREGVMNALVHRDYSLSGSTMIAILPDSMRISNPGGLPDELRPADLKKEHASLPRNPDIAHVCFLHGLIEKIGRGTQRIVEDCRKARLPEPKWQSSKFETVLTLFAGLQVRPGGLNERQEQILAAVKDRGQLRPKDVVRLVPGVTDRTLRSDLQEMVDRGLLRRRGRGRSIAYVPEKAGPG